MPINHINTKSFILVAAVYAKTKDNKIDIQNITTKDLAFYILKSINAEGSIPKLASSICGYLSKIKNDPDKVHHFNKEQKKIPKLLLEYCGEDYDKLIHRYSNETYLVSILQEAGYVEIINEIYGVLPEYFIPDADIDNLEYFTSNVEVYCITNSLFWPAVFLPQRIDEVLKVKNRYNYILTERDTSFPNLERIYELANTNYALKNYIKIRTLFNSNVLTKIPGVDIILPMANDIVIYNRRRDDGVNIVEAIIGTKVGTKYHPNNRSIKLSDKRAEQLYSWFKAVWHDLKDREIKWDIDLTSQLSSGR